MPSSDTLRHELLETLRAISAEQFEEVLFRLNPPAGILPGRNEAQLIRSIELLRWAEGPAGAGLEDIRFTVSQLGYQAQNSQLHSNNLPSSAPVPPIPHNLPRSGALKFVGRNAELDAIQQAFSQPRGSQIVALSGMGGVGKTELALQYALQHKSLFPGGICWIKGRSSISSQVIQFARLSLKLSLPKDLETELQVEYCWRNWPAGQALILVDDLAQYRQLQPFLPADTEKFKFLITTRSQLGRSVHEVAVNVLDAPTSLELLTALAGPERIQNEIHAAADICQWLGQLPLGLEIIGRYIYRKPDLTLETLKVDLASKRLQALELDETDADMTADTGVADAFRLSWDTLEASEQRLAYLLSLFALEPVPWFLIASCFADSAALAEEIRDQRLLKLHLLERVGTQLYRLHQLVREFIQDQFRERQEQLAMEQLFCDTLVGYADQIPESLSLDDVGSYIDLVPHIEEMAKRFHGSLSTSQVIATFVGLGRFYKAQGAYRQAATWYQKGIVIATRKASGSHPNLAKMMGEYGHVSFELNNLEEGEKAYYKALDMMESCYSDQVAPVYADTLDGYAILLKTQDKYDESEALYSRALAIRRQVLGENHPDMADSYNNLGVLYIAKGDIESAETLLHQCLTIRNQHLDKDPISFAKALSNLAMIAYVKGDIPGAAQDYRRALGILIKHLGKRHRDVASICSDLGYIYLCQQEYAQAKKYFQKALKTQKDLLGKDHPDLAGTLTNIAILSEETSDFDKARRLFKQALAIRRKKLGTHHREVGISHNDLGKNSELTGDYQRALQHYRKALAIFQKILGDSHADTIKVQENVDRILQLMQQPTPVPEL